ncbi:MAG: hypothetical protein RMJ97_06860, partial [Raineya sp.]|nr:hypothetical protein [Raineya sp.]
NIDDKGLKTAFLEADKFQWSKEDLEAYEYARMRETDEKAEKMKLEMKIEMKTKLEIAKNAIKKGFDNQTIYELTGLSVEEIEELKKEIE